MTQILFAGSCNIGRSSLNDYLSGKKRPSLQEAFLIQTLTHREVPAHSWLLALDSKVDRAEANQLLGSGRDL